MTDKKVIADDAGLQDFANKTIARVDVVEQTLNEIGDLDNRFGEVAKELKAVKEDLAKASSRFVNREGQRVVPLPCNKAEFQASGFKALYQGRTKVDVKSDGRLGDPEGPFAEWQRAGDDLQMVTAMVAASRGLKSMDPRGTRFYQDNYKPAFEQVKSVLKDAMDTAAAAPGAGDWIPTEMSRQYEPLVEQTYRAVQFVRRETLPRFPFKYPVQSGNTKFKIMSENTASIAGGGSPTAAPSALEDQDGTEQDITSNVTFGSSSGGVLAGVFTISDEADEDSVVALLPFARTEMPLGLGRTVEDAVLNGDTTSTHMDSDVTVAADARKLFKGLRYFALQNASSKIDAGGNKVNTNANVAAYVRTLIAGMGGYGDLQQFGAVPQDLCVVVDTKVFNQLLEIPEYRHLNTFGGNATIQGVDSNIAFPLDGMNLVVSAMARDNLSDTGVYDGAMVNKAALLVFHRMAWVLGTVRPPRVQVFTDSYFRMFGQTGIMLDNRFDLQAVKGATAASQQHTVITYDIGL